MISKIMSVLLSLTLCINTVAAQEIKTENNFDLSEAPMVWSPQKKKLKVGDLELTVWIMPRPNLIAPIAGYLVYRSDLGQMKERLDNLQKRIDLSIKSERAACDLQLVQKDKDCADINKELRDKLTERKNTIDDLNSRLGKEENLNKALMWVSGAVILSLTGTLVAISVK
jgi:hypothetical protein